MSLEQRLRAELDRAAPASIPDAPAVDTMRAAVAGRRRRNRALGGLAGAVVVVAVSGAIVASRDDATVEVATAGGAEATATTPPSAAAEGEADAPGVAGGVDGAEQSDAVGEQGAEKDLEGSIGDEMGITTRLLEASTPVVVETRPSTVDFAGGSGGVHVATDDGSGLSLLLI